MNPSLTILAEVTGTRKTGSDANELYGSVRFLNRVCNNAARTINLLRHDAKDPEMTERLDKSIRSLGSYLGFENADSSNNRYLTWNIVKEALNTIKSLQFNEEWKADQPLREGHIVRQGTVEAVEAGTNAKRLVCVRERSGRLAMVKLCEVKPFVSDDADIMSLIEMMTTSCRDVADAQLLIRDLVKDGTLTINPGRES